MRYCALCTRIIPKTAKAIICFSCRKNEDVIGSRMEKRVRTFLSIKNLSRANVIFFTIPYASTRILKAGDIIGYKSSFTNKYFIGIVICYTKKSTIKVEAVPRHYSKTALLASIHEIPYSNILCTLKKMSR